MVGRVLITPSGLKVSKAGYEVLSAAKGQLMFDSEWAHTKVWVRGSGIMGAAPNGVSKEVTVYYGKTFSRPPMAAAIMGGFGSSNWASFYREGYEFDGSREWWWGLGATFYNDRVVFWHRAEDPYDYNPNLPYQYVIMDYTL